MATARQIESNRKNAEKSTGPKTEEGKARSRANAFKHGMAGDGPVVASAMGDEAFEGRRESWAVTYKPADESGEWALDRAVAASFRIESCELAFNATVLDQSRRACLAWDLDRRVDASAVAAKLARNPSLVARQLEATRHGCALMMSTWDRLEAAHDESGDWTEAEASIALDLLGVPAELRSGRTPLDAPEGVDPSEHRRGLIREQLDRLGEFLVEALEPLDDLARSQAAAGHKAIFSKQATLILRYERDAWSRYRAAIRDLKTTPRRPSRSPRPRPRRSPPGRPSIDPHRPPPASRPRPALRPPPRTNSRRSCGRSARSPSPRSRPRSSRPRPTTSPSSTSPPPAPRRPEPPADGTSGSLINPTRPLHARRARFHARRARFGATSARFVRSGRRPGRLISVKPIFVD